MLGWLFFLYPFAEIYAYLWLIETSGFGNAVLLTLGSGLVGILIMSGQGRSALFDIQRDLSQGKNPSNQLMHRLLIFLGGLLIFFPGLINDVIGIALVLPGTRHLILFFFKAALIRQFSQGRIRVFGTRPRGDHDAGIRNRHEPEIRVERDAEVIDVTPLEITHEKKDSSDS
jgi:UPF0716 protein FxsA